MAINLTIGENGIFSRAGNATEKWKEAEANESQELDKAAEIIVEAADTGYSEAQTYTINESTNQLNWRVLGFDKETGGIKLIAGEPLKANTSEGYLTMEGAEAYVTGYEVPDKISNQLYGEQPYVAKARSVKIEDINEIMGIETSEDIRKYNALPNMIPEAYNYNDPYSVEDAYTPESYLAEKAAGEEEGGPRMSKVETIKPVVRLAEAPSYRGTISGNVTGYAYIVNASAGDGKPYVTLENQRIYNMLFNDAEYNLGKPYWLSSRGVTVDVRCSFRTGSCISGIPGRRGICG